MKFGRKSSRLALIIGIILIAIGGAGGYFMYANHRSGDTTSAGTTAATSNIDTTDESAGIDWSSLPTKTVALTNDTLTISDAGTYVLSGTSTAGVVVKSDGNVRLLLNGVDITSSTGAAIYVENANNVVVELADGTTNSVEDASKRSDETIDGAIFSSDDITFTGNGTLNVTSNFADAIVSKDDLTISSGTYVITSVDEGIRGKDSVQILGGTITIKATGDGIKATNDTEADKGYVYIKAGTITIDSGDDGINAVTKVVIDGGTVAVNSSVEGIEGTNVTINDGSIAVNASDDGINAASSVSGADIFVTVNGGTVTVTVGQGDTDAIDANGAITVNGGTITITAPTSSFDYDTTAQFNGGTIIINGQKVDAIPVSMMRGGGMR